MPEDVTLELPRSGECGATVGLLTDEGAEAQVNRAHMPFQISSICAGFTTCDTLEGLLLEVDGAVMLQHISPLGEELATRDTLKGLLLEVDIAQMHQHICPFEEAFATFCACRPCRHWSVPAADTCSA